MSCNTTLGTVAGVRYGLDFQACESARPLSDGTAGAGLPRVRGFPRGRRAGGGPGAPVVALPPARGVLRRPGRLCVAGNQPVGRCDPRAVAVVEPEPAGLPPRPTRPGRALPWFGRPAAL